MRTCIYTETYEPIVIVNIKQDLVDQLLSMGNAEISVCAIHNSHSPHDDIESPRHAMGYKIDLEAEPIRKYDPNGGRTQGLMLVKTANKQTENLLKNVFMGKKNFVASMQGQRYREALACGIKRALGGG